MTQKTLYRKMRTWRKRLGLEDWKLRVRFVTEEFLSGLTKSDSVGASIWNADRKSADIYVLLPHILAPEDDYEEVLVHEMLHVLLEGHHMETPPDDVNVERAINQLSKALLNGYRGKKSRVKTKKRGTHTV